MRAVLLLLAALTLSGCRRRENAVSGSAAATAPDGSSATLVPAPGSFTRVDATKKEINLVVLVVGDASDAFLRAIHAKTAPDAGDVSEEPGSSRLSYLPLQLGDIRGYKTRFHLYAVGSPESGAPPVEPYAEHACGLVVVGRGAVHGEAHARRARSKNPDIAVAFLGHEAVAREWSRGGGPKPVFEGAMADDAYFPALKATAKACLVALRDEQ